MLCSGVAVAVGCLACWHVILISRGETSVEVYVNKKTKKKMKKDGNVSCNVKRICRWKLTLEKIGQPAQIRVIKTCR